LIYRLKSPVNGAYPDFWADRITRPKGRAYELPSITACHKFWPNSYTANQSLFDNLLDKIVWQRLDGIATFPLLSVTDRGG